MRFKVVEELEYKTLYRVGSLSGIENGLFFADDVNYYNHSLTGYKKNDANKYGLHSDANILDVVKDLGFSVNSFDHIRGKINDFERLGMEYEEYESDDEYGYTDTDSIAYWGRNQNYDAIVIRDVYNRYSEKFNEYIVYSKDVLTQH